MLFEIFVQIAERVGFLREALRLSSRKYAAAAVSEYKAGRVDSAIANYEKAVARSPHDTVLLSTVGEAHYDIGNYSEAEDLFRRALIEDYTNPRAFKGLAFALHARGKTDEAVYYYFRYLDIVKDDYDVLLNLGALFQDSGQYEQAIEYSQRAARVSPEKAAPHHNLAVAYFDLGRFSEAEASVREAIAIERSGDSLRLLGLVLETQERIDDALAAYQDACGVNPSLGEACLDVGRLLNKLSRYDEYLDNALRAVTLFEGNGNRDGLERAYWELGWAYFCKDDWARSAEYSRKALEIYPNASSPRFNLGLALLLLGETEAAKQEYETGIRYSKATDLKNDGINDLQAALDRNPELAGGREILARLAAEYSKIERPRQIRSSSS